MVEEVFATSEERIDKKLQSKGDWQHSPQIHVRTILNRKCFAFLS